VSAVALAERGIEQRVAFVPGPPFFPDGAGDRHLRLAFSRIGDQDIPDGARRLGVLIRAAMGGGV
jgi:2-aminoadipate transaminase